MPNTKEVEQAAKQVVPDLDNPNTFSFPNRLVVDVARESFIAGYNYALSPLEQSENKEEWEWVKVTEDILLDLGFEKIPNFNVLNSFIKNIGRNRHISIGCVGTPNLMVFLCETDREDHRKVNDLICLHNWDYDGEIYLHQLQDIISALTRQERK